MRQVEAEVHRRLPDFLLHVRGLSEYSLDDPLYFLLYHRWLYVPEECWQGGLEEFEQLDVVFEDRVLDSLDHELQERLERQLRRHVLPVDLRRHCVTPVRIQVVNLLLDLLDRCHPRGPAL